jgi:hypothetical protein
MTDIVYGPDVFFAKVIPFATDSLNMRVKTRFNNETGAKNSENQNIVSRPEIAPFLDCQNRNTPITMKKRMAKVNNVLKIFLFWLLIIYQ